MKLYRIPEPKKVWEINDLVYLSQTIFIDRHQYWSLMKVNMQKYQILNNTMVDRRLIHMEYEFFFFVYFIFNIQHIEVEEKYNEEKDWISEKCIQN